MMIHRLLAGAGLIVALTGAAAPCAEEVYRGKALVICPDGPCVFIDGVRLGVRKTAAGYVTVLNQHQAFPTLQEAARNAVELLE